MNKEAKKPYYNKGKIEVIDFLEDQKMCLHLGMVLKYICRNGAKREGTQLADLNKALYFLERKINLVKNKTE